MNRLRINASWAPVLLAMLANAEAARADAPAAGPASRAVAIFTVYERGGGMRIGATASGVLVHPSAVVTWAGATSRRTGRLSFDRDPRPLDRIVAAVRTAEGIVFVRCKPPPADAVGPLHWLEVEPADRAKLAGAAPAAAPLADLANDAAVAVGVVAPVGLAADQLAPSIIPPPFAVTLKLGKPTTLRDQRVEAVTILQSLPPQFAGAGVWQGERLVGILAHHHGAWYLMDTAAVGPLLASLAEDKTPEATPSGPTPEPTLPVTKLASPPLPPAMSRLIAEVGGKPTLDPGFVDLVGQDQADMAMAMIAGGKPTDGLKLIDDILFLARGQLAEQLTYRRALALTLTGDYEKATADAAKLADAQDPLVRSRSLMLAAALERRDDPELEGKPLTDPAALRKAAELALGNLAGQIAIELDAVARLDPAKADERRTASERLGVIQREIADLTGAWPAFAESLARRAAAAAERFASP